MKKDEKEESKILRKEIVTDQSDPRMIQFRKERADFEANGLRKFVRLEITEYAPDKHGMKMETVIGYYEGEPTPEYREFFRKLYLDAYNKYLEEQKGKAPKKRVDMFSLEHQNQWKDHPLYDENYRQNIDEEAHLHTELMNVMSSAGCCLNTVGNIAKNKEDLIKFLNEFELGVQDIISFPCGATVGGRKYKDSGNLIFEWIGPQKSPLNERGGGRGINRTSIDAYILVKINGKVTQLLIEWKFTESYNSLNNFKKFSGIKGNERLRRYSDCLAQLRRKNDFPFNMRDEGGLGLYDLGYEPLLQLLRMTLLAKLTTPFEFSNGLKVEDYRIVHLTHSKNKALDELTQEQLSYSPGLKICVGVPLHTAWKAAVLTEAEAQKFYCGYWDKAIKVISESKLKEYLTERYVG